MAEVVVPERTPSTPSTLAAAPRVRGLGRFVDVGALLLGLAVLAAWMHFAATRPLTWDEVDYVQASRAGTWANLNDRGAMGPITFLRFSLAKARHQDATSIATAAGYREDDNLLSLRHWHPPGGLLLMAPAVAVAGPERGARLTQLGWTVLLALILFSMLREVAPGRPGVRAGALLAVLLDPLTRSSVLEAHVHVAVAAAFLLPVWVWLRVTRDPLDARWLGVQREAARPGAPTARMAGVAGATVLGLALGVLFAFAVVGPLWAALWLTALLAHRDVRAWLGRDGGAPWLVGGALAATLVLWPGAFTKLSLVQTYALRLYAVLFEGGKEWSSAGGALASFVRESPALVVYVAVAVAALARGLLRGRRDALGTGAAALAFLIVMIPFSIIDRYLLAFLPLAAVAGATLFTAGDPERDYPASREVEDAAVRAGGGRGARVRRWLPAAIGGAVLASWAAAPAVPYPDPRRAAELRDEYAVVDSLAASAAPVLAEGGHIYRFYSSHPAGIQSVLVDYDGQRLLLRHDVRFDTVRIADARNVVLRRRGASESIPPVFDSLQSRCVRVDRPTTVHFTCGGGR